MTRYVGVIVVCTLMNSHTRLTMSTQADSNGRSHCCWRRYGCYALAFSGSLHQNIHRDFLCHQKVLLTPHLAGAAVKREDKKPQAWLQAGAVLRFPGAAGSLAVASLCRGQKRSLPAIPPGTHRAASLKQWEWWALLRISDSPLPGLIKHHGSWTVFTSGFFLPTCHSMMHFRFWEAPRRVQ